MLEAGTAPWSLPWGASGGGRPLRFDGQAYRGANVLNLWAAGMSRGFASRTWTVLCSKAHLIQVAVVAADPHLTSQA